MRSRAVIFFFAAALTVASNSAAYAPDKLIFRIDSVTASIQDKHLVIEASGAVRSGGWMNPHLHIQQVSAPEAHTVVVDFLATPPSPKQVVVQTLLPMTAKLTAPLPRYGAIAVKVVSETNDITTQILP